MQMFKLFVCSKAYQEGYIVEGYSENECSKYGYKLIRYMIYSFF